MKCPNCSAESSGKFCPTCGASLRESSCTACGAKLVAGARFCTRCGAEAGAAAGAGPARGRRSTARGASSGDGSNLPWYIAGAVLTVLIIILVLPMIRDDSGSSAVRTPLGGAAGLPGAAPGTAPGTPPPLTGTPREQADRLFNRIMTAREAGDDASAQMFVPMATQAYQMAQPLDDDGLYHLAMVHIVGRSFDAARQTAEQTLQRNPNHLLALAAAGEAADLAGDAPAARDYYSRFLEAYDTEIGRALPEYQDHAGVFPDYRETARRITGR